jgi:hypothetical protein
MGRRNRPAAVLTGQVRSVIEVRLVLETIILKPSNIRTKNLLGAEWPRAQLHPNAGATAWIAHN